MRSLFFLLMLGLPALPALGLQTPGSTCDFGQADYGAHCAHDNGHTGQLGQANRGVYGQHNNGHFGYLGGQYEGVYGRYSDGTYGFIGGRIASVYGVYGQHSNGTRGHLGSSIFGAFGLHASGNQGWLGSNAYGAFGSNSGNRGWLGSDDYGAFGQYDNSSGNYGYLGSSGVGAYGEHTDSGNRGWLGSSEYGTFGIHDNGNQGWLGSNAYGAFGLHASGNQGYLGSSAYGVYGQHQNGTWAALATASLAAYFDGDVIVTGSVSKGGGSFKIDHPLNPEGQYLAHSFVESPDMKNVYDGNVVLDAAGEAVVALPAYFEALNRDFRYQLTAIGTPGPNLYIAEMITGNQFKIAGGAPGMEVSWQVTGIRRDAWAEAHRIVVEEDKPAQERGYYLHPALYGQPEERSVAWARDPDALRAIQAMPQRLDEERQRMEAGRQRIEHTLPQHDRQQ